jgi:hypothetical protein
MYIQAMTITDGMQAEAAAVRATEIPKAFEWAPEKWYELQAQLTKLTSEPEFREYLRFQRAMWRYSPLNTLLIRTQKPEAQLVQSMTTWNALGRHVIKGEHALRILVPIGRSRSATLSSSEAPGESGLDAGVRTAGGGEASATAITKRLVYEVHGFRMAGKVFDISQTEGDPVPEGLKCSPLEGAAPEALLAGLMAAAERRGCRVSYASFAEPTKMGDVNVVTREIRLRETASPAQHAKTLCHELAHLELHGANEPALDRGVMELEAESVAFITCGESGLDTGDYSFSYVATWAAGRREGPVATLQASAGRIQQVARKLLAEMTPVDSPTLELERKTAALKELKANRYSELKGRQSPRARTTYAR